MHSEIPADPVPFQLARNERQAVRVEHDADQDEKDPADDGDAIHVSADFLEVMDEGAHGQGYGKEGQPDAQGITEQELHAGHHRIAGPGEHQNGPENRSHAWRPSRGERHSDEQRPNVTRRPALKVDTLLGHEEIELQHTRSEEHTSELQSRLHLVCRLLLEKKKRKYKTNNCCLSATRHECSL